MITDTFGVEIRHGARVTVIAWGSPVRLTDTGERATVIGFTRAGNVQLSSDRTHDPIARGRAVSPGMLAVARHDGSPGHEGNVVRPVTEPDGMTDVFSFLDNARQADGKPMGDERLEEVFALVKPAENWKYPISAQVDPADATSAEISAAVVWYTGSLPEVWVEGDHLAVEADGYYAAIGS